MSVRRSDAMLFLIDSCLDQWDAAIFSRRCLCNRGWSDELKHVWLHLSWRDSLSKPSVSTLPLPSVTIITTVTSACTKKPLQTPGEHSQVRQGLNETVALPGTHKNNVITVLLIIIMTREYKWRDVDKDPELSEVTWIQTNKNERSTSKGKIKTQKKQNI